jgi:hypothetical protein
MNRRILSLVALAVLGVPGCGSSRTRGAGYMIGTMATFTGVVLLAGVAMHPPECERARAGEPEPDPWCLAAVGETVAQVQLPMLLTAVGIGMLAGTGLSTWLHRDDEPRTRDQRRREKSRFDRRSKHRDAN